MEEITFDPKDWKEFGELAHQILDDALRYMQTIRERPVWKPAEFRLETEMPMQAQGMQQTYEEFVRDIYYHPLGNIHPRFWGWVNGCGSPQGAIAEFLTAVMNTNVSSFNQVAIKVERQVLGWFKQMLQYPQDASGIFVTGGSVANLVALTVARTAGAPWDLAEEGLNANHPRLIFYASTEAHFSVGKAIRVLGLGNKSYRKIPVNDQYEINVELLKKAIDKDRAEGNLPCCVIANAGTVNTAAFDSIAEIADLCAKEKLWLHVDGAFGAFAKLSPEFSKQVDGMERADSVAFDLHKWFCMPYDIGCVLVRDPEVHRKTFSAGGAYTAAMKDGLMATDFNFSGLGLQQSRVFRALKAWFLLKEQGVENYRKLIEQNIHQAKYLSSLIEKQPDLEICAPVSLNIVCFRYRFPKVSEEMQNELNQKIIGELHNSGIAVPSYTVLNGKFVIRVSITNHRSRKEDFDLLVDSVLDIGRKLL